MSIATNHTSTVTDTATVGVNTTSHVMPTYNRQLVAFSHGKGCYLFDTEGKVYLDALSGIAVSGLGHAHPTLVQAISDQASKLIHTSNIYRVVEQEQLADKLAELSHMDEVFFCNSGAEANEAAIKLARYYGYKQGIEVPQIIVMEKAWHGRTIGTLAATGSDKAKVGFGPLPEGFIRVPFNNLSAIEEVAETQSGIVAILCEVLQGEGGIQVAELNYLRAMRRICDERGWLLMIDEVQSGIGRTGLWFAHQHAEILPDVMPLAKGLGSGVPIGACLTAGKAAKLFGPGSHGTTFGGGPLVCRAALTTLEVIENEGLLDHVNTVGNHLKQRLMHELKNVPHVVDIRGKGLMLGIELSQPCAGIVAQALADGLLINVTSDKVVRLLPPLIITLEEVDLLCDKLVPLIKNFKPA
jgi:acetylornithine/N-succinyldiaminopimelate aminotransferase